MSALWAIIIVVALLVVAGGAYAYWMVAMQPAAAPSQNTLVADQAPQDEMSAIESELNAQGDASFDAEVDNLENSF